MKKSGPLSRYFKLRHAFFAISLIVISGCQQLMQRSSQSGYGDLPPSKSGWNKQNSAVRSSQQTPRTWQQMSNKSKLKQLEAALVVRKDLEQYSKWLPWFRSDEEKIEFLSLPGFEARQKWISQSDMQSRAQQISEEVKPLIEARDIALGMPEQFVKQSWGEPESVEVSGQPEFKNFRWKYNRYLSTNDGYKLEKKTVYLEGGKVVGWEVE
jgi:hypothetical protein